MIALSDINVNVQRILNILEGEDDEAEEADG
jgi:hypothetical protein